MRRLQSRPCSPTTSSVFVSLLLLAAIGPSYCIPHSSPSLSNRRTLFESLALPQCALPCFISSLTNDGCDNETDFKCHCGKGKVLISAASCVNSGCSSDDKQEANDKVRSACRSVGVDLGDDENDSSRSSSATARSTTPGSSTRASETSSASDSQVQNSSTVTPAPSTSNPTSNPTAEPAPSPSQDTPSSQPTSDDPPPSPTDMPLALLPTERQLSPAAKAGISVSVIVFASAILITMGLYIRRLKRDLKAAQAAAGVPESVWRAHISTAGAPATISRRSSWRSSRGRSPPVSPLSPGGMSDSADSVASVLKKKRGHVLSVVVERVEEEDSASMERMVREPVPGQKEGLVDPLELDGEGTGIVELPTSITPRTRSRERSRDRGSSFGESSRASSEKGRYMM